MTDSNGNKVRASAIDGEDGVWATAAGSNSLFYLIFDTTLGGINISGKFGDDSTIWYPIPGYRADTVPGLFDVWYYGRYWSVTPVNHQARYMYVGYGSQISPSDNSGKRGLGYSVRCYQITDEVAEP